MTYILSDLEGSSIKKTLEKIPVVESENIIITGDIIDSTMTTFNIDVLQKYKSNNLENINYCVFTDNLTLLLGNRDLCKIKLINALKIKLPTDKTTDQYKQFNDFNNGCVDMNETNYTTYFNTLIDWQYPLSDFLPIWNKIGMEQYKDYMEYNLTSTFITRFKYIFMITMNAGNLLYSIPYEINTSNITSPLINMTEITTTLKTEITEQKIQGKDISIINIIKNTNNFNHHAFIVCAVFISLLYPVEDVNENFSKYITTNLNDSKKFKQINFTISNNSNFCTSLLYILYMKESTKMIYLYDKKYLLSHGGITKYCINLFKNYYNINIFLQDITNHYNKEFEDNLTKSLIKITNNNFNLTYKDFTNASILCNSEFKRWIYNSYNIDTSAEYLKYLSYFTTESANASVTDTDELSIKGKQYCSPIGPGFVSLSDANIQYLSKDTPIIQIFGHKPFGFANSFYKINEKNMLVCLDVSNSFSTTTLNNDYNSYNYIYIKNDTLTSKSKVCLNISNLDITPYTNISCVPTIKSKLYHNTNYTEVSVDPITLDISNDVNITDDIIQYTNYTDAFSILNTNFNKCYNNKLIYNGYLHKDNKPFFVFTVVKDFFKDFYILLFDDIYNFNSLEEYKKTIHENYDKLNPTSTVNIGESAYKYLKYKNKYLNLKK